MKQMFQDPEGKPSATRVVFLAWAIAALVLWVIASLSSAEPKVAELPSGVTTVLVALAGVKGVQSFAEWLRVRARGK